jgi:MYXO-CTERM domain-containing protein
MKTVIGAGAACAAMALAGAASADVTYSFESFVAAGSEFFEIFAAGELVGTLTGVSVDAVLLADGADFTWADDLSIMVGAADLSTINLQAGGLSNYGAAEKIFWSNGASGAAGTTVVDTRSLVTPLDISALTVFLGNGYSFGGATEWGGSITLIGVDVVPAPGALALLGLAGLAGSRRRRA